MRPRVLIPPAVKKHVVRYALNLPDNCRIKPTCRAFRNELSPSPVQVRKWIRKYACEYENLLLLANAAVRRV